MSLESLRRYSQFSRGAFVTLTQWSKASLVIAGLGVVAFLVLPTEAFWTHVAVGGALVCVAVLSVATLVSKRRLERELSLRSDVTGAIEDELSLHQERARLSLVQVEETEAKYREVVESAASVILRVDASGTIIFCNDYGKRVLGYNSDEIVGRCLDETIPVGSEPGEFQLEHGEPTKSIESELSTHDGKKRWIAWTIKPIRSSMGEVTEVLCIGNDLTELKRAEAERRQLELQLLQSQKLEALGRLAGGVAHDFNNLLMGIRGCSQIMLAELSDDEPHHDLACEIEEHVSRASDLTTQLLAFGRGGKFEVRPIRVNEVVEGTTMMFARTKKELKVELDLSPELWSVEADTRQMEQVILKLCLNAWQAMPDGGELHLETKNAHLEERQCEDFTMPAGRYVHISMSDNGAGMDQETQRRIFEPFFSTKKMGRGVGLGLASVYGIVKNHGGFIFVESAIGQGTAFHVYLPASGRVPVVKPPPAVRLVKNPDTILLVDDEPMILRAGRRLLEKLGYTVLAANGGEAALETYKKNPDIGVVVLDMVMPGMSGAETFYQLKRVDPHVRVLLSSGYSADGQAQALLDDGCDAFMQKPYDMGTLSDILKEILARHAA